MNHTPFFLRAALGLALLAAPAASQFQHASASLYTRVDEGTLRAAIEVEIDPGWHLYHVDKGPGTGKSAEVTLAGDGLEWGEVYFPEPERHDQAPIGDEPATYVWVHYDTIVIYVTARMDEGASAADAVIDISGLTCEDGPFGTCVPYSDEGLTSEGSGPDSCWTGFSSASSTAQKASLKVAASDSGEGDQQGLLAFLGLAVFWGLFTLLMPCTYPMIPITISFFTKQADARGGKVLPLSLLYGAGIVLIFILIGVIVGAAIIPFATHPVTNLVIAGFFILFAFALFGKIDLSPPAALMKLAGKASMTGGYLGVFLMGVTLVVTSFTCTAPFVGSLLSVGAKDGNLARIVMGMGTFGLTMAIPFVMLSLVPGKIAAMPRSGQWMNTLKVTLGYVELAAALKFLSNADLVWGWQILSREVFLLLWGLIFAAAAAYLIMFAGGTRARPFSGRVLSSAVSLVLAVYCLYGMGGREMDRVMTAIVPNYSGGRIMPAWWVSGARHRIVVDDYARAVEIAREEGKHVLLNFTGYT